MEIKSYCTWSSIVKPSKDECTPLLFINDKLVAWGEDTYQQYLDSEVTL
ncbi:DUF3192 domain-containing protein [Shewanella sp. 202IG2-18]|nr:DUF3192 domain-containing protein [Parashewanella hymeniacidonis]